MAEWRALLEEVMRARRPQLVGYASLFAPDRAAAEDLVQEALVRVFARSRALPSAAAAEGYVRQAIRTAFLDQARKDRTWRDRRHLFTADEAARGPEQAVTTGLDVEAALTVLSPRERACVVLRFYEDLPVAQVAAALGIGEGAVKRYLSDGSRKLREVLDADVTEPSETAVVTPITPRRTR